MAATTWPAEYETLLRAHLPILAADAPLEEDASLSNLGLDSLATVAILVEIEERFGIQFPDELLTAETFSTASVLWRAILDVQNDE